MCCPLHRAERKLFLARELASPAELAAIMPVSTLQICVPNCRPVAMVWIESETDRIRRAMGRTRGVSVMNMV
ncbi:hypothetical protein C0Z20_01115 [Trinickia symbiotica]|uniref:Uncharacterized protein n=1 Tax=Trinickia symbiotica TaxID=863227 RepID=A0A2N7XA69_9BURK|nr:hypothetical protein C0Z20_01115 [Trinickia symbiotica]